jgi:GT2 family glycosyltransferase
MDVIDVIVPVHKGIAATRRCLDSVLAAESTTPSETVVIDDKTPEPEITRMLDGLAAENRITLLRNEMNLGFVRSVNRGMALHADRDVVLLNSDTEVAGDWLDRIRRCVYAHDDIGTATPFSNNATICSYPYYGWTGGVPGTLGLATLDRMFATTNAGKSVDLPTGVGSCLYIRRACLDRVGAFDAERFGRGYGEENDFCLRAVAAGWRNVLAGDVFVYHEGAVSFAAERADRADSAQEALLKIHPDYMQRVRAFVAADSMKPLREAIDGLRVAHGGIEAASVLAERAEECSRLKARLADVEALSDERAAVIAALRTALARAESLVALTKPEFENLHAEIGKLRAGLSHAEMLAVERLAELQYIQASFMGRLLSPWLRKK